MRDPLPPYLSICRPLLCPPLLWGGEGRWLSREARMGALMRVVVDAASCVPVASGKASRAKSSLVGRFEAVLGALEEDCDALAAPANEAVEYEELRRAVADHFVAVFGMREDGAMKVAGDTLGCSAHGLHLRKRDAKTGKLVVFVREAAEKATAALAVLHSQPPRTSDKVALSAVRTALGLPVGGAASEQVVGKTESAGSVSGSSVAVGSASGSSVVASAGDAPGQELLFEASAPKKPAHAH